MGEIPSWSSKLWVIIRVPLKDIEIIAPVVAIVLFVYNTALFEICNAENPIKKRLEIWKLVLVGRVKTISLRYHENNAKESHANKRYHSSCQYLNKQNHWCQVLFHPNKYLGRWYNIAHLSLHIKKKKSIKLAKGRERYVCKGTKH